MKNHLIFFYGDECEHCKLMEPLVAKLEGEIGESVTRMEIDHSDENLKHMQELDKEPCGGVPFFVNTKTGKTLCGEVEYEELRSWAEDK